MKSPLSLRHNTRVSPSYLSVFFLLAAFGLLRLSPALCPAALGLLLPEIISQPTQLSPQSTCLALNKSSECGQVAYV